MATPQSTIRSRFSLLRKSRRRHSADDDTLQVRPSSKGDNYSCFPDTVCPADRLAAAASSSSSSSSSPAGAGALTAVPAASGSVPAARAEPARPLPGPPPARLPLPLVPPVAADASSSPPGPGGRPMSHSLDGPRASSSSSSASTSSSSSRFSSAGSVADDLTTNSLIKFHLKKSLADLRRTTASALGRLSPKDASSQASGRRSGAKQDSQGEPGQDTVTAPGSGGRRQRIRSLIDSPKSFFGPPKSSLLSEDSLAGEDPPEADPTRDSNPTSDTRSRLSKATTLNSNATFCSKTSRTRQDTPGQGLVDRDTTGKAVLDRSALAVVAGTAAAPYCDPDPDVEESEFPTWEKWPEESSMVCRWTMRGHLGYNRL